MKVINIVLKFIEAEKYKLYKKVQIHSKAALPIFSRRNVLLFKQTRYVCSFKRKLIISIWKIMSKL